MQKLFGQTQRYAATRVSEINFPTDKILRKENICIYSHHRETDEHIQ